jgi:beta-glucanase (GH16 family)
MKNIFFFFLLASFSLSGCVSDDDAKKGAGDSVNIPTQGLTSPTTYPGMTLAWSDEFDGATLNQANWTHETGNGQNGWGNNELQFYRPQNTSIQDGHLVITAKKEAFGGREYTSSRIITKGKQQFRYGRVDIRASLPKGQGIWPALWMLGSNFDAVSWPACGEIDIMEMIGGNGREKTVHGTVHWEHDGKHAQFGGEYSLSSGTLSDKFHVYSIVWDANSIRWFIDNKQYHVIDTTPAQLDEFRRSFFFIFNIAVGGNWPGSPDANSTFPQHMIVDYVRVFQNN